MGLGGRLLVVILVIEIQGGVSGVVVRLLGVRNVHEHVHIGESFLFFLGS